MHLYKRNITQHLMYLYTKQLQLLDPRNIKLLDTVIVVTFSCIGFKDFVLKDADLKLFKMLDSCFLDIFNIFLGVIM